jgi:hypothetical protein
LYQERKERGFFSAALGKKHIKRTKKKWQGLQILLVFMVVGAVTVHSNHRVDKAQKALSASYEERSSILSQMKWIENRAKDTMGVASSKLTLHGLIKNSNGPIDDSLQSKVEELSSEVTALKEVIRETSRVQLEEIFESAVNPYMEVALSLEGMSSPMVVQISHKDLPYTAWMLLDQVRRGVWDNSLMRHVGDHWIEISPIQNRGDFHAMGSGKEGIHKVNFREASIPIEDACIVGLRSPHNEAESGMVLTIHLNKGTCGADENEVCFGKLVDGFDTLNEVDSAKAQVTVANAKVV